MTGAFRVEAPDGQDVTPKGTKECAAIALLATSASGKRTRAWLQSKLWSDRGKAQASASLRQALVQLRKRLGAWDHILDADRQSVWLDLSQVELISDPRFEFLEGLDVRDEEFEAWLSFERSARAGDITTPAIVSPLRSVAMPLRDRVTQTIMIRTTPDKSSSTWWAERLVADVVIRSLTEEFSLPVMQSDQSPGKDVGWIVDIEGSNPAPSEFGVRSALLDVSTNRQVWSGFRAIRNFGAMSPDQPEILKLTCELAESVAENIVLSQPNAAECDDADALCRLGMRRLFTMRPEMVQSADDLFGKAYHIQPRGVYLAWRAQVREVQKLERLRSDFDVLKEESLALTSQAMEREPGNSMVLALLANSSLYVSGDADGALELARRSVRINPGNPMAWWALSASRMMLSDAEASYKAAQFARYLTQRSQFAFWAEGQLAGAALALGRLSEAKELFRSAAASCPHYRPALRHLLVLHAQDEEWDEALATMQTLQVVEPDFTAAHMLEDANYPVALLRRTPEVDLSRVRTLASRKA
ncbi:MAG: hypothetical protein MK098_07935 [Marinovum sp.]|nr:hypothetical protein [Marinovum sp.]